MRVSSNQAFESLNRIVNNGKTAQSAHYTDVRKAIEERDELKRLMAGEEDRLIEELQDLAEGISNRILAGEMDGTFQDMLNRVQQINSFLKALQPKV